VDTFSLRLHVVDDDGDVILDEIRSQLMCDRRVGQEKFMATYTVENCGDSSAPSKNSKGDITLTAITDTGELIAIRTLQCKE